MNKNVKCEKGKKGNFMKSILVRTVLAVFIGLVTLAPIQEAQASTNRYKIAHVKHQGNNMVIVWVSRNFFYGSNQDQSRWFTAIQQCVRSANLAGQTLLVTEDNGRFRYYGPNNWHNFLRTIDREWVRVRLNKELTCTF
jgi:hypothetical protein